MISMNSPLPPAPTPETLQGLFDLAKLLADPTAAAQRIADFKAAADELHAQSEEARTSQSALAADQVAHQQALEKASAEHAATLAQA